MTVVPNDEGQSLSLVCDTCGQALNDIECPIRQWPVVWSVVSRTGWTGSPLAIGPHHCPQCDEIGLLDVPPGGDRGVRFRA